MDDAAKRLIYERNGVSAPRPSRTGFSGTFSNPDAQRIIAERNGRGLRGTAQLAPDDAQRIARIQTNRQARGVLGVIAQVLHTAYENHLPTLAKLTSAGRDLQRSMTSRLDGINNWVQRVYAGIPDDDAPVSDLNRRKVALALAQARDAVNDIDNDVKSMSLLNETLGVLSDWLTEGVERVLQAIGGGLTNKIFGGNTSKWVKIVVGGVVVLGAVGLVAKLVHVIMLGRTSPLGEAEDAAMAIADAQRHKRRKRRALTIS